MSKVDEILLELYQKVSDGNFIFWLSVFENRKLTTKEISM